MGCSGFEYCIEENLKWKILNIEIIEFGLLRLNISGGRT